MLIYFRFVPVQPLINKAFEENKKTRWLISMRKGVVVVLDNGYGDLGMPEWLKKTGQ